MKIRVKLKPKFTEVKPIVKPLKSKQSNLEKALEVIAQVPVNSFIQTQKPNIKEVTGVFDDYRLRCNAIQIANLRNPGKWDENMLKAQKDLFADLAALGLAKHICFNKED